MHVEIQTLAPQRLAYLRYTGPYGSPDITQTWGRFAAWCAAHGLMEPRRTMYGLSLDNPAITSPDKCRYDCCVEVDQDFHGAPQNIIEARSLAAFHFGLLASRRSSLSSPKHWRGIDGGSIGTIQTRPPASFIQSRVQGETRE